jgi:hypothetical protein
MFAITYDHNVACKITNKAFGKCVYSTAEHISATLEKRLEAMMNIASGRRRDGHGISEVIS